MRRVDGNSAERQVGDTAGESRIILVHFDAVAIVRIFGESRGARGANHGWDFLHSCGRRGIAGHTATRGRGSPSHISRSVRDGLCIWLSSAYGDRWCASERRNPCHGATRRVLVLNMPGSIGKQSRKALTWWPGRRGTQLPFALLQHTRGNDVHYDLMLELGVARLGERSLWELQAKGVPSQASQTLEWRKNRRHRKRYLTYEGDIGLGRGFVERVDEGHYVVMRKRGRIEVSIDGRLVQGRFRVEHLDRGRHAWVRI